MLSSILEITPHQQFLMVILGTILAWVLHLFGSRWARPLTIQSVKGSTWRAPLLTVLFVLLLRAALQPALGTPVPKVHDEFSYLLLSDTFSHFRVTNPTPVDWQHFETFHVNMVPTYHSKYPIGLGIVMAIGQVIFRSPWIGVYLTTALMAGAVCWALQAFVEAEWALLGGMLCALRLGLVSYWMNSYWGGSLTALGGALCLGAAARLVLDRDKRDQPIMLGTALGVGLAILGTTRPFEGACFFMPLFVWLMISLIRERGRDGYAELVRAAIVAASIVGAALLFLAYYNYRTTGSALLMPYTLYERTYSFTPVFLWSKPQAPPVYRHAIMHDFYTGWQWEFYRVTRTWNGLVYSEQIRRIQLWLFFIGSVMSIPFVAGVVSAIWSSRTRIIFWCGATTFFAYTVGVFFQPHYFAPATVCVFALLVLGLRAMWRKRWPLLRAFAGTLCVTGLMFTLIEGYHSVYFESPHASDRQLISKWVEGVPGKHLILVNYAPGHEIHRELVFNNADFQSEEVVWAHAMTPSLDAELCRAYPDRRIWNVITNEHNVELTPSRLCKDSKAGR